MDSKETIALEQVPISQMGEIKYCDKHWAELLQALCVRNLQDQITVDEESLRVKLEKGQSDPCLDASTSITTAALQMFGPFPVLTAHGCPVCCFENVIEYVADNMQIKYGAEN